MAYQSYSLLSGLQSIEAAKLAQHDSQAAGAEQLQSDLRLQQAQRVELHEKLLAVHAQIALAGRIIAEGSHI